MKTICDKKELRKIALEKRALFSRDKSIEITQKILNSDEFKIAKNIALYLPIKHEIDITGLLNFKSKNFYLPRCNNNDLEFVKYNDINSLVLGKFNILEPIGDKIQPDILDIIYIPALMANSACFRLGYGKGYYDRFFKKYNLKAKKYIIVARELISDEFMQDEFDYKCDGIISA